MERIGIRTDTIQLDQFLKLAGAVPTGGAVKQLMLENRILVNGVPETARRKKLSPLDVVTLRLDGGEEVYQAVREE